MDRAFGILFSLQRGTSRHGQWVVECLKGSWHKLVGQRLASVCCPVSLTDSVLKIEILDDSWGRTVRDMLPELQDRLCEETCGEVKKVRVLTRTFHSES